MEVVPKVKLSAGERLESKVKAALEKRDRLLEALEKEISSLESKLIKAKELRNKLNPGEVRFQKLPASQQAPGPLAALPAGPLKGFRSNGRLPIDPVDAIIREGKIG